MKLNKSQRFTAYCIMLAEAQLVGFESGICLLSEDLFGRRFYDIRKVFLEIRKIRNGKNNEGWWWKTSRPRIKLLKQCIIETHP